MDFVSDSLVDGCRLKRLTIADDLATNASSEPSQLAVGTGTDVAMNSARVTLVKGMGVTLADGVLFPLTGWLLAPMIAALRSSLC